MAVEEKRNINEDFGNRLREIIEKRKKETGQNLRAVAKDLDVSLGVLSDWQNGNKTPRGDSIAKLAKYFGVSADYLLGLTEAQTVDTDLRAVADYTGLTENAILALKDSEMFECYDRSQKKILSDMLSDESCLHQIVNSIYLYLKDRFSLIFRITALLKRIAPTASIRSFFIRTMSALSMATSVPAPIAIPTSAEASAGASLIPSPIIATLCPLFFKADIFSSFCVGSTPAMTSSIPT